MKYIGYGFLFLGIYWLLGTIFNLIKTNTYILPDIAMHFVIAFSMMTVGTALIAVAIKRGRK